MKKIMPISKQKILIVGASGSLGKGIIAKIQEEHNVVGTYCTQKLEGDYPSAQVDITDKASLDALDSNFNTVILIAGAMPAEMKGYEPQRYIDVNITGAKNVLDFCIENGVKKIIYIMTFSDVSGAFYTGNPIKEEDSRSLTYMGDHAVYAITKVAASELLEHYHQEYGLQTIQFRIPTVYCNDDNFQYYVNGEIRTKAYVQMIQSIVTDSRVEIWGNPKNAKDMPYIKDFASLINKAVSNNDAQGLYNAGTANPVSLDDLVNAMIEVFGEGREIKKVYKPHKKSQPNFTFDMAKTSLQFSYEPMFDIKQMLLDMKESLGLEAFRTPN